VEGLLRGEGVAELVDGVVEGAGFGVEGEEVGGVCGEIVRGEGVAELVDGVVEGAGFGVEGEEVGGVCGEIEGLLRGGTELIGVGCGVGIAELLGCGVGIAELTGVGCGVDNRSPYCTPNNTNSEMTVPPAIAMGKRSLFGGDVGSPSGS